MSNSNVPRGEDHALRQLLGRQTDRVDQLFRLMPGSKGGGSVEAPFTIGGFTFDPASIARLLEYVAPNYQPFVARFDQGVTTDISATRVHDEYLVQGEQVYWNFNYEVTGTGTAGDALVMSMPVLPAHGAAVGTVFIYSAGGTTRYNTFAEANALMSDGSLGLGFGADGAGGSGWGVDPNVALGPGDLVRGNLTYRLAPR